MTIGTSDSIGLGFEIISFVTLRPCPRSLPAWREVEGAESVYDIDVLPFGSKCVRELAEPSEPEP